MPSNMRSELGTPFISKHGRALSVRWRWTGVDGTQYHRTVLVEAQLERMLAEIGSHITRLGSPAITESLDLIRESIKP